MIVCMHPTSDVDDLATEFDLRDAGLFETPRVFTPLTSLPKVAVFDFDGTLASSEVAHIVESGLPILHQLGFSDVSGEEFERTVRDCNPLGTLDDAERARVEEIFWDRFNEIARPEATLIPGVPPALTTLQDMGIENAIFTARPLPHGDTSFEELLRDLDILEYISAIEGKRLPACYVRGSDKTDQIIAIAEALQVDPSEMLVCGDTPADVEAGNRKHAAYVVAVRSGGISEEVLEAQQPDAIFNSVPELVRYMQNVAASLRAIPWREAQSGAPA